MAENKFLDKIKDLFSDEEEVIETKEVEVEESVDHKLPTFMRNKIEEEQKREEAKKERENATTRSNIDIISDREIVKTRSNNNFSFPIFCPITTKPGLQLFSTTCKKVCSP